MATDPDQTPDQTPNENTYDADSIQVLKGLDAVRKRPGMYIGDTTRLGPPHMVFEVSDNALDEALAAIATGSDHINAEARSASRTTARNPTGSRGRGVSAAEVIMTTCAAGSSKRVGRQCLQGSAAYGSACRRQRAFGMLELTIWRDGEEHACASHGEPDAPLKVVGKTDKRAAGSLPAER